MAGGMTTMRDSSRGCSAIGDRPVATAVVLDTGALLASLQLRLQARCFTVPGAVGEVKDQDSRERLELSLNVGKLQVVAPNEEHIAAAKSIAKVAGVLSRLSSVDLEVLALGLQLSECVSKVSIATDDYAVQLAALRAGLGVIRVRFPGVKELRKGPA